MPIDYFEQNDRQRRPSLDSVLAKLQRYMDMPNIADELDEDLLETIGKAAKDEYEIDVHSREEWMEGAEKAMDIALQVRRPKSFPFQNASNVKYPLITVAALQFGARAYPAIIDGNRIVRGIPLGSDEGVPQEDETGQQAMDPETQEPLWEMEPGAKRSKAERIGEHMSYQLLYEMEDWEEDTDVLLHHLPIVGCCFRKVWRDQIEKRNRAEMVEAVNLVVHDKTRNLKECPRITHETFLYPYEVQERQLAGVFLDVELPKASHENESHDEDAPYELLEQHRLIDLDEDGYREPYIVTLHKDTGKVLRIVANYDFDEVEHDGTRIVRIPKTQYFVKYSFLPDPKGGFYDIGFGKLLESLSQTIDTTINQILDAGTLQNAGGGFIGSGVRLKQKDVQFAPGKYTYVESTGTVLKDAIYNFEHPGPSKVLFELLGLMIEAARDITAVKDILTGDSGDRTQTATTTLALIEQGLKVFTAIYKRVYRALSKEFKLLFKLNSKFLSDEEYYTFSDTPIAVAKSDYDSSTIDVLPVSDPRMVTEMQRLSRVQAMMPLVEMQLLDTNEFAYRFLERIGEENIEDLLPKGDDPTQQLQIAGAMAELEEMQAGTEKTKAETEKIKVETVALPIEKDVAERKQIADELKAGAEISIKSKDTEERRKHDQMMDEQRFAMEKEMMGTDTAEKAMRLGMDKQRMGMEQERQDSDIYAQEEGLKHKEKELDNKAKAERAKAKGKAA